jgi:hypothetical protein
VLPLEVFAVAIEETVVLAFTLFLRLDAQLDLLADCCLDHILFVCTDRLPVLYPISITGSRPSVVGEQNEGNMVIGMVYRYGWDRGNPCCPQFVFKSPEGSHLPTLYVSHATNFVEYAGWGGPKSNEDVIGKVSDIILVHILGRLHQGEQFGSICRV